MSYVFFREQPVLGGDWETAHYQYPVLLTELGRNSGIVITEPNDGLGHIARVAVYDSLDQSEPSRVVKVPEGSSVITEVRGIPLELFHAGPVGMRR